MRRCRESKHRNAAQPIAHRSRRPTEPTRLAATEPCSGFLVMRSGSEQARSLLSVSADAAQWRRATEKRTPAIRHGRGIIRRAGARNTSKRSGRRCSKTRLGLLRDQARLRTETIADTRERFIVGTRQIVRRRVDQPAGQVGSIDLREEKSTPPRAKGRSIRSLPPLYRVRYSSKHGRV